MHAHVRVLRRITAATAAVALALLAACGGGSSKSTAPSQVAVKVNDGEVSVHQVQLVLKRNPRLVAEHREAAGRKALDSLVEQELAAQAARAEGLETDPGVIQAIEAAKREALARAYQDRLAERATAASADEVDRYYDAHPALFEKRQIYSVQEFTVEVGADRQAEVKAALEAARSPAEQQELLRSRSLRFTTRALVLPAEGVPLAMLDRMVALAPGQSLVESHPTGLQVLHLVAAQPAPLDRAQAKNAIETFLLNEKRRKQVEQGMKALRDSARIEFVGSFAEAASAPR
nr:EpsD family peptidyl-prolyl cis-trans isomerase [uncultured Caldimonas sp.]